MSAINHVKESVFKNHLGSCKTPMPRLHPNKVMSEPLGWGPGNSLESCPGGSSMWVRPARVGVRASDRSAGHTPGSRRRGSKKNRELLSLRPLPGRCAGCLALVSPFSQMMKLRFRKAQGHPATWQSQDANTGLADSGSRAPASAHQLANCRGAWLA